MPWLESYWSTYGRFPFIDEWLGEFNVTVEQVEAIMINPLFKRSCKARGIDRNWHERGLSERQAATIALLANIGDPRTESEKLAQINVSREEFNGWMQIPAFKQNLHERSEKNFGNLDAAAYNAVSRGIEAGNFRFVEFYFKMTGKYDTPEAINIKRAMRLIEDTVRENIKDPTVLQAIADRFNEIREDL
jgi:hypothetical protein